MEITDWIGNHTPTKQSDVITQPCPNLNVSFVWTAIDWNYGISEKVHPTENDIRDYLSMAKL